MATQIRFRRGTTAQHATFVGAAGEVTVDTDKKTVVVHDGVTPGGQPLPTTNSISDVVRFDSAQTLTLLQRGQARANIGAGVLTGFRNKIINGDFDVWQRGTSQTTTGYGSDDRWLNSFVGGSLTHSRQAFPIGQTEVPGAPTWFSRSVVTHAVGASNFHNKTQAIENVRILSGQRATLTFYAKADAPKNIAIELTQFFGTGGAPSAQVTGIGSRIVALTASWQKFTFTVDIPSVTGKVLGTNGNDYLGLTFWFEAGANFNSRTANLGQQSGTFDTAHVSFVEGDATTEENPFSALHPQQVLALCQRYCFVGFLPLRGVAASSTIVGRIGSILPVVMRALPSVSVSGFCSDGGGTFAITSVTSNFSTIEAVEVDAICSGATFTTGRAVVFRSPGTIIADAEL